MASISRGLLPTRDYSLLIAGSSGVDGEMAPAVDPPSGRVPEQDQSDPRNLSAMAAELCCVFGKILRGLGFFRRDQFIGQRAS